MLDQSDNKEMNKEMNKESCHFVIDAREEPRMTNFARFSTQCELGLINELEVYEWMGFSARKKRRGCFEFEAFDPTLKRSFHQGETM